MALLVALFALCTFHIVHCQETTTLPTATNDELANDPTFVSGPVLPAKRHHLPPQSDHGFPNFPPTYPSHNNGYSTGSAPPGGYPFPPPTQYPQPGQYGGAPNGAQRPQTGPYPHQSRPLPHPSGPSPAHQLPHPSGHHQPPPPPPALYAVCLLQQEAGNGVFGRLLLDQPTPYAPVRITAEIHNLRRGEHGWHIHKLGDLSGGCSSTGGHFNPHGLQHGAPDAAIRHVGDLGNIRGEGVGRVTRVQQSDRLLSLQPGNVNSVVGRAVVVHAGRDDLGLGGKPDSKTTGAAGGRLACCTIGIAAAPPTPGRR